MFELMRMIQELKQKVDQQVTSNRVRKQFLKGIVHTKSSSFEFFQEQIIIFTKSVDTTSPASIRFQLNGSIMRGMLLMFINLNFNLVLIQN